MIIPTEFYEVLRNHINVSDVVGQKVKLTRKAADYFGLCPFHGEKTPSFSVNNTKKFYYCFGCGARGDIIKFTAEIYGMSYKEAAIKLAQDYGIELPKVSPEQAQEQKESEQLYEILELAQQFFVSQLNNRVIEYLSTRGIGLSVIKEFGIGYAPGNGSLQKFFEQRQVPLMMLIKAGLAGKRSAEEAIYEIFHGRITFPIRNIYNKVIAFGGRVLDRSMPKYLNSPETILFKKNQTLYGENKAINAAYKKKYVILVEGYMDVIAMQQAGFDETAASLGTAVTEGQLQRLWRAADEIVLCLDGDNAGKKAASRVIEIVLPLVTHTKNISFIQLPQGKDPDDVLKEYGVEYVQKLCDNRLSLSNVIWYNETNDRNFASAEARATLESLLQAYCQKMTDHILRKNYHSFFKEQIWQNIIKKNTAKTSPYLVKGNKIAGGYKRANLNDANLLHNAIAKQQLDFNYSEIEMLEYSLLAFVIKYPELSENEGVLSFFERTYFTNDNLQSLMQQLFYHNHNDKLDINENIKNLENSEYGELINMIKAKEDIFLANIVKFNTQGNNFLILWELLTTKYRLIMLSHEFEQLHTQSNQEEFLTKAFFYQQEIAKTQKILAQLLQDLEE